MDVKQFFVTFNLHRSNINSYLGRKEPLRIVLLSFISGISLYWLYDFLHREETLQKRIVKTFFKVVKKLPFIREKIEKEISKNINHLEMAVMTGKDGPLEYRTILPDKGFGHEEIINETAKYEELSTANWKDGFASGTVYIENENLNKVLLEIYEKFLWSNPLHPNVFPDIRKMEAEVVRMICNMYKGDEDTCGTTTSGGTESIMLAMKTYRDMAIDRGVRIPEMIVPVTAHAAFDKAAQYFRMMIHHVQVDPISLKVDIRSMKKLINRNTCVLVGSAPQFPHGIVDPISEIAQLGEKYNVPVHVDCCLGGFLLPFMESAGCKLDEKIDFTVSGITSISCDSHKYGFAPKGSSVILYRSHDYRKYQFFVQSDWPGGVYASPTFAGSRPGVNIATCWASMMFFGLDGYIKSTKEIVTTTMKIKNAINKIPGLKVLGDPKVCVVSIGSDRINIYNLLDGLNQRGWHLNPLQFPFSIHIAITKIHTKPGIAERFINDVKEETEILMELPNTINEGSAAIYGMAQSIPDRSLVTEIASGFIAACYKTKPL